MYKRLLLITVIIITCISCETKKHSIKGNWYRYYEVDNSSDIKSNSYEEVYFTKDSIFSYNELGGYISPSSYKIVKDTFINTTFHSKFIINKITENSIKYSNEYGVQFEMKKQTEKPTLEDYIRKKVKQKNYTQSFLSRLWKIKKPTSN